MKKIFIFLLGITIAFTACKKGVVEDIDGKTVDERLTEALTTHQKRLTDAPYGWKMIVFPEGLAITDDIRSAFSYYMEFTADNRVTMVSDFNLESAAKVQTSSYRLSALQRPTLIFDTYSYVGVTADPNLEASKSPTGKPGKGWGSDFQFAFTENYKVIGDTIHLDGILHHSRAFMVKATQAEQANFKSDKLAPSMVMEKFMSYFKRLSVDGKDLFEITPAISGKGVEISYMDGTVPKRAIPINYYYTPGSIHFVDPIVVNGLTIRSMDNLVFDNVSNDKATCTVNGKVAVIQGSNAPIAPDIYAANFWKDSQPYYFSYNGFTINGVTDGLNLKKWKFKNKYDFNRYIIYVSQSAAIPLVWNEAHDGLYDFESSDVFSIAALSFFGNGVLPAGNEVSFSFSNFVFEPNALSATHNMLIRNKYYTILKADGKTWDLVQTTNSKIWMRLDREI